MASQARSGLGRSTMKLMPCPKKRGHQGREADCKHSYRWEHEELVIQSNDSAQATHKALTPRLPTHALNHQAAGGGLHFV